MTEDIVRELGHLTLGSRLRRLGERLQGQTQELLDVEGLSIQAAHFPYLAALDRLGPATVGELAEAVGGSQPGATRALRILAEAGAVRISVSSEDQRRKSVALTREGRRLVETGKRKVWPMIEAAVREACGAASDTLLDQLTGLEEALAERSLAERSFQRRAAPKAASRRARTRRK